MPVLDLPKVKEWAATVNREGTRKAYRREIAHYWETYLRNLYPDIMAWVDRNRKDQRSTAVGDLEDHYRSAPLHRTKKESGIPESHHLARHQTLVSAGEVICPDCGQKIEGM